MSNDVFCANESLSGTMRAAVSVPLERAVSVTLLMLMPWGSIFSVVKKFLCGADHSRGENARKRMVFETNDAVVYGFGVMIQ